MDLSDCLSPVKIEMLKEDSLDFAATNGIVAKAVKHTSGTEPEQVSRVSTKSSVNDNTKKHYK